VTTAEESVVRCRIDGPVAVVSIHAWPAANPLTVRTGRELVEAIAALGARPETRVIVLEGSDTYFCTGAPPERMLGPREDRVTRVWELLSAPLGCPVPVVAAAQGHALGGGFLLALCCDVVVLSRRSRYAANFLRYAFTPIGGATSLLPARLGASLGAEMLYTARSYSGAELERRGAGIEIVEHDEVTTRAHRTARLIAQAPRPVLESTKALLAERVAAAAATAMAAETAAYDRTATSAEAVRRIRAATRRATPDADRRETP
jgi:polyketide biosynthesis enoyl-CoA hydratase PksI